jgi:hypothetical protein
MAAPVARRQNVGRKAGRRRRQVAYGLIQELRLDRPPREVVVADPARPPRGPAAGEENVAARLVQFLRDLTPGLAAADD